MNKSVALILLTTLFSSVAQLLFKEGAMRLPDLVTNWPLFTGVVLYALGAALLVYALKGGEVSILYPITSSSYIWVTLFAWYFFDEQVTVFKLAGLALVIVGIIMLGRAAKKTESIAFVEPV
ncbi:EamA family transporter [Candidatus Woesearchaeota archaeon]|nr:EamA family transporter [Candidatus Woesearchaeota archaeon]